MSPKAWAKFFTSPFILQAHWQLRFHLKQCPLRWLSLEADTEIQKILAIPIYIFSEQKHFFSKNAKKKEKKYHDHHQQKPHLFLQLLFWGYSPCNRFFAYITTNSLNDPAIQNHLNFTTAETKSTESHSDPRC